MPGQNTDESLHELESLRGLMIFRIRMIRSTNLLEHPLEILLRQAQIIDCDISLHGEHLSDGLGTVGTGSVEDFGLKLPQLARTTAEPLEKVRSHFHEWMHLHANHRLFLNRRLSRNRQRTLVWIASHLSWADLPLAGRTRTYSRLTSGIACRNFSITT